MSESTWTWERPSYGLFLRNCWAALTAFAKQLLSRPAVSLRENWRLWAWWLAKWVVVVSVPVTIYAYRYAWEPYLFFVPRKYLGGVILATVTLLGGWFGVGALARRLFPRSRSLGAVMRPVGLLLSVGLLFLAFGHGKSLHTYFSQHWRYQTLGAVEPERYPTTREDRVWPLNGIHTYASQQMNETEAPTKPNLVRDGSSYVWTMGVEPGTPLLRFWDDIEEVISLPSTVVSFNFRRGANVRFETGETLLFSRNIFTCVRRAMWFWQAATYEPADNVVYLKNSAGRYVQVVPMIRWAGVIFPRPEFGGVFVIEQSPRRTYADSVFGWFHEKFDKFFLGTLPRVVLGCGTWIAPEDIGRHPYLVGQNIVPFEVTRYMAASTRFRAGLTAPMPWRREGDMRIADLPENVNPLPFTLHFDVWVNGQVVASKLFQYVALEPEAAENQALSTSLLVPADGIGRPYLYWHFGRSEACIGVTAVSGWVRSSKRGYVWATELGSTKGLAVSIPSEHRPFIRDLPDKNGVVKTRWAWLTTVVTVDSTRDPSRYPHGFITGTPEIAITDCHHPQKTVWVGENPAQWPDELREKLGPVWADEPQ